ncbi:MAG: hypothetical protein ACI4OJ_05000 [Lachnospiraceae bacterium]
MHRQRKIWNVAAAVLSVAVILAAGIPAQAASSDTAAYTEAVNRAIIQSSTYDMISFEELLDMSLSGKHFVGRGQDKTANEDTFEYDANGNMTELHHPYSIANISYDGNGIPDLYNIRFSTISPTSGMPEINSFEDTPEPFPYALQYDASGRLIAGICKSDNSSFTGMVNQYQIAYDDLGRITAVYSNLEDGTYQNVTTYSYNGKNQVAQTNTLSSGKLKWTILYRYNRYGEPLKETGTVFNYDIDDNLDSTGAFQIVYSFAQDGTLKKKTRQNGDADSFVEAYYRY